MTIEMKAAAGSAIQTCVAHLRNLGDDATQAHWNVQGMAFGPLHKLFGKIYEEAYDLRDEFAEFARALGVQINVRALVEPLTTPIDVLSPGDTCEAYTRLVLHALEALLVVMRVNAGIFNDSGDLVTSDLFIKGASKLQHLVYLVKSQIP